MAAQVDLAAAVGNMALTIEPSYSGIEDKNCTAERFLEALNAQRRANRWDDERTISQAHKFLRGAAFVFFEHGLPTMDPEAAAQAAVRWDAWQKVFKENFFSVAAANHVSTGWARLRQLHGSAHPSLHRPARSGAEHRQQVRASASA